jgi:hypothetical protein
MAPFFTTDNGFPTISLALEYILPQDTTSPRVQERAVYQHYVKTLAARPSDDDLRPFRDKALMGQLTPPDFAAMHTLFTSMKSRAQDAVTRRPPPGRRTSSPRTMTGCWSVCCPSSSWPK